MIAIVQARDEGGLDEDSNSSMERGDPFRADCGGGIGRPVGGLGPGCGREQGLEGQVSGQSAWVEQAIS